MHKLQGDEHLWSLARPYSQPGGPQPDSRAGTREGPGRAVEPPGRIERFSFSDQPTEDKVMNSIIYIVGLVVIVVAILSFLGLG
jgi:hypothetical protein